jgi:cytochrome c
MKDPLLGNKIAGAALFALLLFFGLPQIAERLFGGHGEHHGDVALAYPIPFEFAPTGAGEAAAEVDLGTLLAAADPKAGERRAALCKSCHTFEKGGADSTGPNLWGVVGRPVASHPGFKYTSALQAFGGEWTYDRLDGFIANSQAYVPGTAMVQRFAKANQRAEILAYLQTLSDSPVAFPEPAPAAQAATEGEGAAAEGAAPTEPATTEAETATSTGGEAGQPTESAVDTADDAGEATPPDEDASDPNPDHP